MEEEVEMAEEEEMEEEEEEDDKVEQEDKKEEEEEEEYLRLFEGWAKVQRWYNLGELGPKSIKRLCVLY